MRSCFINREAETFEPQKHNCLQPKTTEGKHVFSWIFITKLAKVKWKGKERDENAGCAKVFKRVRSVL